MLSLIAVETSDIVGSTKLSRPELNTAITALKSCIAGISHESNDIVAEFYRGDAFQIMYPNAVSSFKNLLIIKLYMLSHLDFTVKITQSLALGSVSLPVKSLNDRMDDVFINSGRQLDILDKGEIGISINSFAGADMLALSFLNRLIEGLSAKQALVLYWYIKDNYPEHKKIAAKLKMTRQNVNTHLLRGNADLIRGFINHFETVVKGEQK